MNKRLFPIIKTVSRHNSLVLCRVVALLLISVGCSTNGGNEKSSSSSPKFDQYFVEGERLYAVHCSNCHQATGTGLGLVYPPLSKSDYMENNFNEVICLIKNGKSGDLVVNGNSFNQTMPAIPSLTDLEVAEIATYIYNNWEHKRGLIEVRDVTGILNTCTE